MIRTIAVHELVSCRSYLTDATGYSASRRLWDCPSHHLVPRRGMAASQDPRAVESQVVDARDDFQQGARKVRRYKAHASVVSPTLYCTTLLSCMYLINNQLHFCTWAQRA